MEMGGGRRGPDIMREVLYGPSLPKSLLRMEGIDKMAEKPDIAMVAAKGLEGLPPWAAVAVAVRAAWRALPESYGLLPETMHDVAAAVVAAGYLGLSVGKRDTPAIYVATSAASDSSTSANAAHAAASAARAATAEDVTTTELATAAVYSAIQAAASADAEIAAVDAVTSDINWVNTKSSTDDGVDPDFFRRRLWSRSGKQSAPEAWLRVIEKWKDAANFAGLEWVVEQHFRLLEGGGLDVEGMQAFLEEWYNDDQARKARPTEVPGEKGASVKAAAKTEASKKTETSSADDVSEEQVQFLSGGIVTAAADIPAVKDQLGRKPLVDTLADMLSSPDQSLPMTIALLGDWGSGKSSVIRQLKRRLRVLVGEPEEGEATSPGKENAEKHANNCKYLFAEFNAWEYEQTDNIRAGLAQEVVRGLTGGLSWWRRLCLAFRNAATQHGINFYITILWIIVIFLLAVLSIYVGQDLNLDELNTFESLLGTGWVGVLLLGLVKTSQKTWRFLEHPLADKLNTYLRLPDYGKHLGEIPIIKREIESLCEARLGGIPNGRLLVVVDDLDRCHPEKITETLDAIRLVMNLKNVAVIVAIDDRIAFRSVAEHYKDLAQDGMRSKEEVARDYLGKIIQLPVNLYRPRPSEVKNFIGKHLFQLVKEADVPKVNASPDRLGNANDKSTMPRVSPVAATLIKEQGLDATAITGSGDKGRILKRDVVGFLQLEAEKKLKNTSVTEGEKTGRVEASTAVPEPEADPVMELDETKRQEREAVLQDTAFERDLFSELTRDMGFHNPRQLIRLRNSYRLLKGYRHSREGGPVDVRWVEHLLHGLFWYEFLYQQKLTDRRLAELVAWQWSGGDWEKDAIQKSAEAGEKTAASNDGRPANPPVVNMSRRLNRLFAGNVGDNGYADLMRTVQMVVLPNAQMGLLLSRHDVDGALYELTAATKGVPLDPWNLSLPRFKSQEPFSMRVDD